MFVGLPNPHTPFDCPEPYASMYDPTAMPVPRSFDEGLVDKPPIQSTFRRRGRQVNYELLDRPKLRQAMAYYYGAVTLVDDQVGKIVQALEARELLEETVIAFCSDHGEFLGALGMLTKSIDEYPILYDVGLRVPMVISSPEDRQGRVVDEPVELIDLCPTLLECADLGVAPEIQGRSLWKAVLGGDPPQRPYVFSESGAVKMIRSRRHKLVYYPGQPYGELYDIADDPDEIHNLYDDPRYRENRVRRTGDLLNRLIHMEATRHGQSNRGPAYWRSLYSKPFGEG